ncbi:MAG TPA: hypothetical protein DEA51_06125 [Erysipelotrichaceae bacterium]|nr:hypothetical protein [Erysipelotrichaceae bacterium]
MKKILVLLTLILTLAGCSDASVRVSNRNEAVISVGSTSITRGQLFDMMINQDPAGTVITMAKEIILADKIEVTDEVRTKARETFETIKESFGETFSDYLVQYGYKDEQDYIDKALIPFTLQEFATEAYVRENFERLSAEYYPRQVRILQTTKEEDAKAAIAEIQDGANFEDTAKKYSTSTTYKGEMELVHKASGKPTAINTYLSTVRQPTLTSTPIKDDTNTLYYVVQVIEANPERFLDEAVKSLSAIAAISDEMFVKYFEEANFQIYDIDVYAGVKESFAKFLPKK